MWPWFSIWPETICQMPAGARLNCSTIWKSAEPTAALDSKRAGIVMDLLRKLASEQDACIIAVTHDEKIFDRFDLIFHLRDGRLDAQAPVQEDMT